ncbi:ABC transporter ATP-binding protein [Natrinema soli]|uniref:ABC transporter ATP-binding protein n=1 Tax=Natrinema soli TaxID=1930624 RepID=A0ABD5SM55_9EURY|nr:ABC transporter ATP-binding protein [Natrinema soli]
MSDTTHSDEDELETVLEIENLSKSYTNSDGSVEEVLEDIDLTIQQGDFVCLLGQSGCGKSTLLKCVAGLTSPDTGTIKVDRDSIGYVFQEDRLLDWLTVEENIRLVLESKGVPESERQERIERYLDLVGLSDTAEMYPMQLSGGMKQRVSIVRALAIEPDILLLDEPFSALDEITARNLRERFLEMIWELNQTVLFVTHNASEAAFLSTDIVILDSTAPSYLSKEMTNPLDYPRDIDSEAILDLQKEIVSYI